jgi:death-on-curing protein
MIEPAWITIEDCLVFHDKLLARFGGAAGVRDENLLESALARPKHVAAYKDASLFLLAATCAHWIVKNHPFVDGNKRTGFLLAAIFLEANGCRFGADEHDAVVQTLALAAGETTQEDFAEWLKKACAVSGPA